VSYVVILMKSSFPPTSTKGASGEQEFEEERKKGKRIPLFLVVWRSSVFSNVNLLGVPVARRRKRGGGSTLKDAVAYALEMAVRKAREEREREREEREKSEKREKKREKR